MPSITEPLVSASLKRMVPASVFRLRLRPLAGGVLFWWSLAGIGRADVEAWTQLGQPGAHLHRPELAGGGSGGGGHRLVPLAGRPEPIDPGTWFVARGDGVRLRPFGPTGCGPVPGQR